MAFSLSKVSDGERKLFSNKLLLEILGDVINDEIFIDGEAFRISSFINIGEEGSGQNIVFQTIEIPISQDNQTEFNLTQDIQDPKNAFLVINHVLYRFGQQLDFYITDRMLYWHGGFPLEASDQMYLRFFITF